MWPPPAATLATMLATKPLQFTTVAVRAFTSWLVTGVLQKQKVRVSTLSVGRRLISRSDRGGNKGHEYAGCGSVDQSIRSGKQGV